MMLYKTKNVNYYQTKVLFWPQFIQLQISANFNEEQIEFLGSDRLFTKVSSDRSSIRKMPSSVYFDAIWSFSLRGNPFLTLCTHNSFKQKKRKPKSTQAMPCIN